MSIISELLLLNTLGQNNSKKETDALTSLMRLEKYLAKRGRGKDEKKDEKGKHKEWSVEERILLGLLMAACWPIVGVGYVWLFTSMMKNIVQSVH